MNNFTMLCALVLSVASTGCVSQRQPALLDAVGPCQSSDLGLENGVLVVYSDRVNNVNDPSHPLHGSYKIYSSDGALLSEVSNRSGSFNQDPAQVPLAPGNYRIVAQAVNFGSVIVPVVVAARKKTLLDLDQEVWTDTSPYEAAWVHLPNGHKVGVKAY